MDKSTTTFKQIKGKITDFGHNSLPVGFFLAFKQLKRVNKWTTGLIVFIMTLTFLNLVFVNGILVGLIEGSSLAYRREYSADLIIKNFESKDFISETDVIVNTLKSFEEVVAVSPRILYGVTIEAGYKEKRSSSDNPDRISAAMAGIDPQIENSVTGLESMLIAGEYLEKDDVDQILIGSNLLTEYSRNIPGDEALSNVKVGSKVRIVLNGTVKEVRIKGVIKSKIGEVGRRVYTTDSYMRKIINRQSFDVNEISVLLKKGTDAYKIKSLLHSSGLDKQGDIQTWEESQGQFFKDIGSTFSLLGTMIGSIGILVASITVFIVIYINAVTRRKFIGILKGIGISETAIEISYVLQSFFYSFLGSAFGCIFLYGFLKPYIDDHPIDFPFSDGILVAPLGPTLIRVAVLMVVTLFAGYIPAKLIVRKNTLDSILGR